MTAREDRCRIVAGIDEAHRAGARLPGGNRTNR